MVREVIRFGGDEYRARYFPAGHTSCINLRAEKTPLGSKAQIALFRSEGARIVVPSARFDAVKDITPTREWFSGAAGALPLVVNARGMKRAGQDLYVVIDDALLKVRESDLSVTMVGTGIVGAGRCWMDHNGAQLVIVSDLGKGYVLTIGPAPTFIEIIDEDFSPASFVLFFDQFMVFGKRGTQQFFISALADATAFDALDVASSETLPDLLVSGLRDTRDLILFGEETTELWYNAGDEFPFVRAPDGVLEVGCAAAHSPQTIDNTPIWLAREKGGLSVRRLSGRTAMRISTPAMDDEIDGYARVDDAYSMAWNVGGHAYYSLTFPASGRTWVFDAASGKWHRRASEDSPAWRIGFVETFRGKPHAFDLLTGALGVIDASYEAEFGDAMPWEVISAPLFAQRREVVYTRVEIEVDPGRGDPTDALALIGGANPGLSLSWSDDDGKTWSTELHRSMGEAGQNRTRLVWTKLGSSPNGRLFRARGASPAATAIISAYADVEVGR